VLQQYLEGFLTLAGATETGFVLDTQTWRAQTHFSEELGQDAAALQDANRQAADFAVALRDKYAANVGPIVTNGLIGPRCDAYAPDEAIAAEQARIYHREQLGWLAETDIDMVTALTFTNSNEAIGVVRAAGEGGLPVVVSFTVETDGNLPTGETLADAITSVDEATDDAAAYFMVNCAHPDHFAEQMTDKPWVQRIRGLRCNASRMSHAELDECEVLDDARRCPRLSPRNIGFLVPRWRHRRHRPRIYRSVLTKSRLARGLFLERRSGSSHARLAHVAPESVGVVTSATVQNASVVPEDGVPWLPGLGPTVRRLGSEVVEPVDQAPAIYPAAADDRTGMGADVEVLSSVAGIGPHEFLLDRWQGRGVVVVDEHSFGATEDVVVEDVEIIDLCPLLRCELTVTSALTDELCLAAFGWYLVRVQDRHIGRHSPKRGIGVPEIVSLEGHCL
jgi:S-methylmethionine-dependent homocysteine/selenocysteine methylase